MNILFYYPDREKGVSLSSLMIAFQQQGHQVHLLTQTKEGDLHHDVQKHGVKTSCYVINKKFSLLFYLKHILHLISFTRKNKIDLVYSHIQRANFISAFARFFSPSRFILCRHHSDCAFVDNNLNEKMMDKIINFLGKEFIVPSDKVLDQMINIEKIKNKKIYLIRYAYNFDDYPQPDPTAIAEIKKKYPAKLLLIKVARLIVEKRHILLFKTVNKLVLAGFDVKLLVLSDGPEREKLLSYIKENNLQNHIFILGYRRDVMNLVSASDLVVHISESEASSNFVKEVGLLKKPIIVCHDVGDFDEYLINNVNCLLVNKSNPETELENVLRGIYSEEINTDKLGKELYKTIIYRFSITNILKEYDQLNVKPARK